VPSPSFKAIGKQLAKLLEAIQVPRNPQCPEAVDINGRFQMQGGKNWFLPKEMNANRFFCNSHWLEIWSNHFYPSMGPNGGSVAMDTAPASRPIGKQLAKLLEAIQVPYLTQAVYGHAKTVSVTLKHLVQ
jgi:hypothetical protein